MIQRRNFGRLALAALAFAASGCRVETVQVNAPQPGYAPPPGRRPHRIGGTWGWIDRRGRERIIDIERSRGGLVARGDRSGESIFFQRVGPGVFQDERGRRYEFVNDYEAIFHRPNGRSFPMRRL